MARKVGDGLPRGLPIHYTPQTGKTSRDVVSGDSPALSSNGRAYVAEVTRAGTCQDRAKPGRCPALRQYGAGLDANPGTAAGTINPVL